MTDLVVNRVDVQADYDPPQPARERFRATYRWRIPRDSAALQLGHVHTALAALLAEAVPPDAQIQITVDGIHVVVYVYWTREYLDGR